MIGNMIEAFDFVMIQRYRIATVSDGQAIWYRDYYNTIDFTSVSMRGWLSPVKRGINSVLGAFNR
jgi:hypothetical protein